MSGIPEGEAPKRGRHEPTYTTWHAMRLRCFNPAHEKFRYYGGRGITVCARWARFVNFIADMGERPEGHRIDRIDADANYSCGRADCSDCGPGGVRPNCRWLPAGESASRRRGSGWYSSTARKSRWRRWPGRSGCCPTRRGRGPRRVGPSGESSVHRRTEAPCRPSQAK